MKKRKKLKEISKEMQKVIKRKPSFRWDPVFEFQEPKVTHTIGNKHFIEGTECSVRFINNGKAWLCPTTDDADEPLVARHIAYATIDEYGKVEML